jgi:6-phosphogluconolactonase (cycloisomerase 2 family)
VHGDLDYVSSFAIDAESGLLSNLNRVSSGGMNGVSLALNPTDRFLVVANYRASNVAVFPLATDGSLQEHGQIVPLHGTPHSLRRVGHQEAAHPHDVDFDPSGRYVAAVDKGVDGVWLFRFADGKLEPAQFVASRGGLGPRHITFDPNGKWAWVCNELESSVTAYSWSADNGSLKAVAMAWTLPPDFVGETTTAELAFHRATRTLYVSNRGHDSVAMFRASEDGVLTGLGWQPTRGKTPRFIGIEPTQRFLYAANEDSDSVVAFAIDQKDGRLTEAGSTAAVGSPVAIAFTGGPA